MTKAELRSLVPGDCVIGFDRDWSDEFPVVEVSAPIKRDGVLERAVTVAAGSRMRTARVRADGREIRTVPFKARMGVLLAPSPSVEF